MLSYGKKNNNTNIYIYIYIWIDRILPCRLFTTIETNDLFVFDSINSVYLLRIQCGCIRRKCWLCYLVQSRKISWAIIITSYIDSAQVRDCRPSSCFISFLIVIVIVAVNFTFWVDYYFSSFLLLYG